MPVTLVFGYRQVIAACARFVGYEQFPVQKGKSLSPFTTATEPVKLAAGAMTAISVKSSPKVTSPLVASARLRMLGSKFWACRNAIWLEIEVLETR